MAKQIVNKIDLGSLEVISVFGGSGQAFDSDVPGSVGDALRLGDAVAAFPNSPAPAGVDGAACGEVLIALGQIQAKLAAAYARFLRRFDAAGAHNADGYGACSAWRAARGQDSTNVT